MNRRAVETATKLGRQPSGSIPYGCDEWADTKATYGLFQNEKVTGQKLLAPHQSRTWERISVHPVVLAVQDTTLLDYTHFPSIKGLGPIGTSRQNTRGIVMHNTLAVTPEGLPLGEIDQHLWVRPESEGNEESREPNKAVRPIEEKESYKWIKSLLAIQANIPEETQVVTVSDAESDVYELLTAAHHCRAAYLIRAAQDRSLLEPETQRLRTSVGQEAVKAQLELSVSAKPKEPARTATVSVRYRKIKLKPPYRPRGEHFSPLPLPPITVYAILVSETSPPEGMTPVNWLLLTNVPVTCVADALKYIGWYCQRWQVEVFHKVLKSGCRIEQRRLNCFERLERCIALFTIIAWRIHWMTWLLRTKPDAPCTLILADSECSALFMLATKSRKEPESIPSVKQAVLWIAQLGGFLNRKSDGFPGVTVIWRGWQRFHDAFAMWRVFHPPKTTYG